MDAKYLILGGGAAACIALGYLGLNFSDEEEEEGGENIKKVFDKEDTKINKNKNEVKREVEEELEDKKINIKISSKEESEEEKTGWGQFWKDQYDSNDSNDSNNNQISAGDFN